MVVRVIARVEEVMVKSSVEPVVEELHRASMEKHDDDPTVHSPYRKVGSIRDQHVGHVEEKTIEQDLVIPVHQLTNINLIISNLYICNIISLLRERERDQFLSRSTWS